MVKIINILSDILSCLKTQKTVFTFDEACRYCGISSSSMYKHTSASNIPFFKPEGKLIYFKREDLDVWMLRNRQATNEELEQIASKHSLSNHKRY